MSGLNIVTLYGSHRPDRNGIRAVKFIESVLTQRGHRIRRLDSLELGLPILEKMYKELPADQVPPGLAKMAEALKVADAFVVVSGEYNHGIPAGLKNMLDHFLEEWLWRPSALVTYSVGSFGGVRAGVALRSIVAELGMPSISSFLTIPTVTKTLNEEGETDNERVIRSAGKFSSELEWYANALKRQRAEGTPF